jgi:outer membrane protein OmpA-like peptidoglycan-associated protein
MQRLEVPYLSTLALAALVAVGSWLAAPTPEDEPRGRVVVTDTETTILDVIEFEPGTATIRTKSKPTLDAVAATMQGNPSIELVEVQSHLRAQRCGANAALSQRRADAVVAYLVAAGVAPARLVAQGYGDTQPIDVAAPWKNERIAFLILKRASDGL